MQAPKHHDEIVATHNAKLSASLQHVMCTSRFAHYLKVMVRDKVGSVMTAEEIERYLNDWLLNYCSANEDTSEELKAKYPLSEGAVEIRERPGRAGEYMCTVHLRPHYQFDHVISRVRLVTEVSAR